MPSGIFQGKIVVHFAGFGGACRGIELATGRAIDDAINHDPMAIECHRVNFPHSKHHKEDVFHVDPTVVAAGRDIDIAWFSPDCTQFSRAKGGKPVKKKIRALAWVVVKWATKERPKVIYLENVREFEQWGPLLQVRNEDGEALWCVGKKENGKIKRTIVIGPEHLSIHARKFKCRQKAKGFEVVEPQLLPDPKRVGETYRRFRRELERLGYVVDTKVLDAADFGAPTHRKRFFLIARCDGEAIKWPEPAYGPGREKKWRAASECINWELPCPSIFMTKEDAKRLKLNVQRPLKRKTNFRIANGLKRYVIESKQPFIVRTGHYSNVTGEGGGFRGQGTDQPLGAVCGTNDKALTLPYLVAFYGSGSGLTGHRVNAPCPTVVSKERFGLAAGHAVKVNHGGDEVRAQDVADPFPTITGTHGTGAVAATLLQYNQEKGSETRGKPVTDPLNTIPTENRHALLSAFIARIGQYGSNGKMSNDVRDALTTITSKQEHLAAIAHMTKLRGRGGSNSVDNPLGTVVAGAATFAPTVSSLATAGHVAQFFGGMVGKPASDPLPTVTAVDHNAIIETAMAPLIATTSHTGTTGRGKYVDPPTEPLKTITGANDKAIAVAHLAQVGHRDDDKPGRPVTTPLNTILGKEHHTLIRTELAPFVSSHYGERPDGTSNAGKAVGEPLPTITGRATQNQLAAASLVRCAHGEGKDGTERWGRGEQDPAEPLPAVTASKDFAAVSAYLAHFNHGDKQTSGSDDPLRTVTASGTHHAAVEAWLCASLGPGVWGAFCRVYEFLKEHLGEKAPLPIVEVDGQIYLIVDVGLRMLNPRELLNAQFSPEIAKDYILVGTKTQQVKMIGNSDPPYVVAAIVKANLSENYDRGKKKKAAA
jgi:DNA (cytosine-5)-methyltransferase 1